MKAILSYIDSLLPELTELRRDLHRHPELVWREIYTSAKIAAYLKDLGYEVLMGEAVCSRKAQTSLPEPELLQQALDRALAQGATPELAQKAAGGATGVIGILRCGEGPTVALRYDIDALPILEASDDSHRPAREGFRSLNEGCMHACGHDGHITIGLGTAKALMQVKDKLHGTVKLIFQPGEEGLYGAKTIVANGHLADVDYAMAAHMGGEPDTHPGTMLLGSGATLATCKFDADFHGRPSHAAAAPQEGCNAILAASTAVLNIHAIPRHSKGDTRVNVGKISGGGARNIIAPSAHIEGEVRGTSQNSVDFLWNSVLRILQAAADMQGCTVDIKTIASAGVNENSPELTSRILDICRQNGIASIDAGIQKAYASEDYTWMAAAVKERGGQSCYFNTLSACTSPVHQAVFDFDERVFPEGVKTYVLTLLDLMK